MTMHIAPNAKYIIGNYLEYKIIYLFLKLQQFSLSGGFNEAIERIILKSIKYNFKLYPTLNLLIMPARFLVDDIESRRK